MHPAQIGAIKQRILRADARALGAALPAVLEADNPQEVVRCPLGGRTRASSGACVVLKSCAILQGFADH
jgi:hypothetical protein